MKDTKKVECVSRTTGKQERHFKYINTTHAHNKSLIRTRHTYKQIHTQTARRTSKRRRMKSKYGSHTHTHKLTHTNKHTHTNIR